MPIASPPHIDGPEAFAAQFADHFPVSRETKGRLITYEAMLRRWQKTINLVSPSTLNDIWHRHIADSAQLWVHRPPGATRWLDLGSGAGFPGLVLAILARGMPSAPTSHTLVESDSRKAAFLREVARETGVAVDILCARIEKPETHAKVGAAHCVTARALAPLSKLASLCAPCFAADTVGLFLKGRDVEREMEEARVAWQFEAELCPSVTDPQGRVLVLRSLRARGFSG